MKAIFDSLDDVPESIRSHAVESGEQFVVDVSALGDSESDREGLTALGIAKKEKVDEFRASNRQQRAAAEAAKKEADDLTAKYKDVDPTKYVEMQERLDGLEKKKVTKADDLAGVFEEKLKPVLDNLHALQTKHAEAEAKLARNALEGEVRAAGVSAGIAESAMTDYLRRGMDHFELTNGSAAPKNGPVDSEGNTVTLASWSSGLRSDAPHLFKASGGAGADGGDGKNPGVGGAKTADLSDNDTFLANLDGVADGSVTHSE